MDAEPNLPIPISLVHGKYLLFSIEAFSYLRRKHHICGALIGTLPQSPSQNVFLGLPVELMPEEAHILVSKGVAYISDDVRGHFQAIREIDAERRGRYITAVEKIGRQATEIKLQKKQKSRQKSLKARSSSTASSTPLANYNMDAPTAREQNGTDRGESQGELEESPFSITPADAISTLKSPDPQSFSATPATSEDLLPMPPEAPSPMVEVPSSYPLFEHLHDNGFYLSPGLRFGCQYTVYPGDPLRFHSHFLAVGTEWDEEIDLMDIVGGGRLGTGVKKGYLFGGVNPQGDVKTFSVEWAGM